MATKTRRAVMKLPEDDFDKHVAKYEEVLNRRREKPLRIYPKKPSKLVVEDVSPEEMIALQYAFDLPGKLVSRLGT